MLQTDARNLRLVETAEDVQLRVATAARAASDRLERAQLLLHDIERIVRLLHEADEPTVELVQRAHSELALVAERARVGLEAWRGEVIAPLRLAVVD